MVSYLLTLLFRTLRGNDGPRSFCANFAVLGLHYHDFELIFH